MPDATYVGAGMPCAQCGNPLTPGQPHKCGRVGNPYAPSADWKPGQDTFTAQAAGIWDEGFAAGRAAANPDLPKDERRPWPIAPDTVMPSRRQPVRWGSRADDPPTEIHDDPEKTKAYLAGLAAGRTEAPAASPDERRCGCDDDIETLAAMANAGDRLAEVVARVCGEGHPALAAWRSVSGSTEPRKETT